MDTLQNQNCSPEGEEVGASVHQILFPIVQGFSLEELLSASELCTWKAQQTPLDSVVIK